MGRRGRKKSFWKKNCLWFIGSGILLFLIAIIIFFLSLLNPYRSILHRAGVSVEECQWKKDILTLTFQGDSLGILSCRDALNALRAEKAPETVHWILLQQEQEILTGTIEDVGRMPEPSSPRVETLNEDLTLLKLKYELAKNGISAEIQAEPTVGLTGKTITVTVTTTPEALSKTATPIPAAVKSVNEEGGGIVRCDVLFAQEGGIFAVASYDFAYGDTLFSSAFYQE